MGNRAFISPAEGSAARTYEHLKVDLFLSRVRRCTTLVQAVPWYGPLSLLTRAGRLLEHKTPDVKSVVYMNPVTEVG